MDVKDAERGKRRKAGGKNVVSSVNVAVTRGGGTSARAISRRRVVQRNGETVEETIEESTADERDGA